MYIVIGYKLCTMYEQWSESYHPWNKKGIYKNIIFKIKLKVASNVTIVKYNYYIKYVTWTY